MVEISTKVEISTRAANFIVSQETGGKAQYDATEAGFDWPGGLSGPTIGIGYDLGQVTHSECQDDWHGIITSDQGMLLLEGVGLTGERAHMWVAARHGEIDITWAQAIEEFNDRELPKWEDRCRKAIPNFDLLSPDSAGALLSLAYNRGTAGFHSTLPRYQEMAAIHDLMAQGKWGLIPEQIAKMVRLWPNSSDLRRRRALEAQLFADGVPGCKPPPVLVTGPAMPANQTEQPAHPAPASPGRVPMSPTQGSGAVGSGNVLAEIEAGLQAAENELPQLLSVLSIFVPGLRAFTPFLGLIKVAIEAVQTVEQATATGSTQAAIAQVVQTLTPGQPGSPALN